MRSPSRNTLSSDLALNCMDSGRCRKNVHHQELNLWLPDHIISCDLSELLTITLNRPCGLLYYLCDDHWLLIVSSPAVIGTRFGISTFPRSEFFCGCASGPYNVWCISPWKRTSVTSVTRVPFFGTPVTCRVYHSLTPQSRTIKCSIAYAMLYLLYYAK